MGSFRTRRIDRDAAEQLLRGTTDGPLSGSDPLVRLLAAARAPGRADELAGEQAALAAFRAAGPAPRPRRGAAVRKTLTSLLTLKLGAVLAATTLGGVALAASTGALPNPLDRSVGARSGAMSAPASLPSADASANANANANANASASAAPGQPAAGGSRAPTEANPAPSMVGLCRAYAAGQKDDHGKSLDDPAFADLIVTAGGRDSVDGYCSQVLSSAPGADPGTHPTGASGDHPGNGPTQHPGNGQTNPPGNGATQHPANGPTGRSGGGPPAPRPGH